jgi:hypothetical protein
MIKPVATEIENGHQKIGFTKNNSSNSKIQTKLPTPPA